MSSLPEGLVGPRRALRVEVPDHAEFEALKRPDRNRLADAQREPLSIDSRFDLACNAAHALCAAALRRRGYRAAQRFTVSWVLPRTAPLGPAVWRGLARCHELRNRAEYEGVASIDERLVRDLVDACSRVLAKVDSLALIR